MSSWKVLVVEDTYDDVQVVSKILRHYGMEVSVAGNGIQCLQMLNQFEPTLIVMDLAMPEMDGWETLVEIRSNPRTARIPIVALTAYHSADTAQDATAAGFDLYLPKPVNSSTFIEDIRRGLGL